jgi:hypothetical protein
LVDASTQPAPGLAPAACQAAPPVAAARADWRLAAAAPAAQSAPLPAAAAAPPRWGHTPLPCLQQHGPGCALRGWAALGKRARREPLQGHSAVLEPCSPCCMLALRLTLPPRGEPGRPTGRLLLCWSVGPLPALTVAWLAATRSSASSSSSSSSSSALTASTWGAGVVREGVRGSGPASMLPDACVRPLRYIKLMSGLCQALTSTGTYVDISLISSAAFTRSYTCPPPR